MKVLHINNVIRHGKSMTEEEFNKVPFRCICHLALANEHTITYVNEDGRLGFCDHTPKNKHGDFKEGYRHWQIDGNVYRNKEKFLEALKDFPTAKKLEYSVYKHKAYEKYQREGKRVPSSN